MDSIEEARMLAVVAAAPELSTPDETDVFLDAMPLAELASLWCVLQRLSRRDQIAGAGAAKDYFDHLPHHNPLRALDLALEVLRQETDKPTLMLLNDKFMLALFYAYGDELIDRITAEAKDDARLRWLLGGIHFGLGEGIDDRIAAVADVDGWRADERVCCTPQHPLDCYSMSIPELARAWIEQYSKSDRDRDDNFFAMMDYQRDLREQDPDKAIDLILEILSMETNPTILSLLAAGPLEDVVSIETIDRIEQVARSNQRFRDLLGGVWYFRAGAELKARLDSLVGPRRG